MSGMITIHGFIKAEKLSVPPEAKWKQPITILP
jgi:hypothetical protein